MSQKWYETGSFTAYPTLALILSLALYEVTLLSALTLNWQEMRMQICWVQHKHNL